MVGTNNEHHDTVFVVENWESEKAHKASLGVPEVRAAIAAARRDPMGSFARRPEQPPGARIDG